MRKNEILYKELNNLMLVTSPFGAIYKVKGLTKEEKEVLLKLIDSINNHDHDTEVEILESNLVSDINFESYDAKIVKLMNFINPNILAIKKAEEKVLEEVKQNHISEAEYKSEYETIKELNTDSIIFKLKDDLIYVNDSNLPLVDAEITELVKIAKEGNKDYTVASIVNCHEWLTANPDVHVRNKAFSWLIKANMALTEDGMFIGYRNLNKKEVKTSVDKTLNSFINEQYLKVKKQKKSPKKFSVVKEKAAYKRIPNTKLSDYSKKDIVGVLSELYDENSSSTTASYMYYPDRKGPYGQEVYLGEPVKMPRDKCDNSPNHACSTGLHIRNSHYSLNLGSTIVMCLVNPRNIVAVPYEDATKFRCCEYLPIVEVPKNADGTFEQFAPGTYDFVYAENNLKALTELKESKSNEFLEGIKTNLDNLIDSSQSFMSKRSKKIIKGGK